MVWHLFAMHRQNIRAMALIVCTFTYLMIGAAIFDALESETDNRKRELVEQLRDKMMNKYNFSSADYRVLETVVLKSIPHKAGHQWRFAGAFYFATVVITTVGYGHSTPATTAGKVFCIFYALAGIPLNLVMFQSIGERLNAIISYLLNKLRKFLKLKVEVSMTHMIMVSSSLGSLVVVLGTYLFSKYENWNWHDSFYYCFITLTTIGFGDYVALQKGDALQDKTFYIIFTLLFILFGMAVFAAAVNLLVLRFMASSSEAADALERENAKKLVLTDLSRRSSEIDDDGAPSHGVSLKTAEPYGVIMRFSSFLDLDQAIAADEHRSIIDQAIDKSMKHNQNQPESITSQSALMSRVRQLSNENTARTEVGGGSGDVGNKWKSARFLNALGLRTAVAETCACCHMQPLLPQTGGGSLLWNGVVDHTRRIPYSAKRAPVNVSHLVDQNSGRRNTIGQKENRSLTKSTNQKQPTTSTANCRSTKAVKASAMVMTEFSGSLKHRRPSL